MRDHRRLAACVALLLLMGCRSDDAAGGEDITLDASCTNPQGFEIAYPSAWEANAHPIGGFPPCSLFDPDVVAPSARNIPVAVAIVAAIEEATYDVLTAEDPAAAQRDRQETSVDGRPALRLELEATGDGLRSDGAATTAWYVDLGDGTFVATTHETDTHPYEETAAVLDRMMETVTFTLRTAGR